MNPDFLQGGTRVAGSFAGPSRLRRSGWAAIMTATCLLGGCLGAQPPAPTAKPNSSAARPSQQPADAGRNTPEWQSDRYSDPTAAAPKRAATSCPTQDAAIRIAMGQILQKYGRETLNRQLPLEAAIDNRGVWTVSGTLPPLAGGRVNKVRIDSRNGKLLSVK